VQWLTNTVLSGVVVEKQELPRPGGKPYYPMATDGQIVVLHTTEGSSVAGAVGVLKAKSSGPHFIVGEGRIVQTRPVGAQGASLHAPENQYPVLQIEAVGNSRVKLYSLPESTEKPLAAILAWAVTNLNVPLQRPTDLWKDDCSDMPLPWAANNKRRQQKIWPLHKGIYGHVEVTNQGPSWHFDPGAYDYIALFMRVQAMINASSEN
jgi:hypothetical protein